MNEQKKKLILVVDDEGDVRKFLTTVLLDAGFEVETANDGFQALEKVKVRKPDLISLDLVMPKHSGAKFFRDLQKNKEWSKIPILIVTGHAKDDLGKADLEELTMSGPGIYLEKPVKPANYIAAICKILGIEEETPAPASEKEVMRNKLRKILPEADDAKIDAFIENTDSELLHKLLEQAGKK